MIGSDVVLMKTTISLLLTLAFTLLLPGCASWPRDAEHPHHIGLQRASNHNFPSQPTMRSEWKLELGLNHTFLSSRGYTGGPALHEKLPLLAIVAHDQYLWLIHRDSGRILWTEKMSAAGIGVPFFVGNILYVPTEDGKLSAYDVKHRTLKWRRQFAGLIVAPMTLGPDEMYVCDGNNTVYALKRESGEVLWQYQHRSLEDPRSLVSATPSKGTHMFSLHGEASPLLSDGKLFVGYSDGKVRAFDAMSGAKLWIRDLAPQLNRFEDVDADFALIGDTLYAASAASGLYALSATTGEIRWFYPLAGIVTLSPFEGDLILGLQHGELGRFSTFNRAFNWRVSFGTDGVPQRPVRFPHGIAVSLSRGGLYVLDVHTGELRDQFSPGSGMQGALALSNDGWLYATSLNGFLYAFSPR